MRCNCGPAAVDGVTGGLCERFFAPGRLVSRRRQLQNPFHLIGELWRGFPVCINPYGQPSIQVLLSSKHFRLHMGSLPHILCVLRPKEDLGISRHAFPEDAFPETWRRKPASHSLLKRIPTRQHKRPLAGSLPANHYRRLTAVADTWSEAIPPRARRCPVGLPLPLVNNTKWNFCPDKIGAVGISAGGELVNVASLNFDAGKPAAYEIQRVSSKRNF